MSEWVFEDNVRCVVCPGCAFTFSAEHVNTDGSGYTCPLPECGTRQDDAHLWCRTLGHESIPAYYLGTYEIDRDHEEHNVPYCRECGDLMVHGGDYGITRVIGLQS